MRLAHRMAVAIMTTCLMACMSSQSKNVEAGLSAQNERQVALAYGYIGLPDGNKILPRYSTIDDVVRSLGEPSEKKYSEHGSKTFLWDHFWTYRYGNGDLLIDFDNKSRRIIRILSRIPGLQGYTFPFGLSRDSRKKAVLESVLSSPGVTEATLLDDGIGFRLGESKELWGMIYIDSQAVSWYCTFYIAPWQGYTEQ